MFKTNFLLKLDKLKYKLYIIRGEKVYINIEYTFVYLLQK